MYFTCFISSSERNVRLNSTENLFTQSKQSLGSFGASAREQKYMYNKEIEKIRHEWMFGTDMSDEQYNAVHMQTRNHKTH